MRQRVKLLQRTMCHVRSGITGENHVGQQSDQITELSRLTCCPFLLFAFVNFFHLLKRGETLLNIHYFQ